MRTNLAQNFKFHLQGNLVHKAFARKEIFLASKTPLCIVIVQCAAPWDSGKLQTWIHSSWYGKTLNKKHERIEVPSPFLSHISYTWSNRLYLKLFLLIKSWCRHSHLLGSVFDLPVDDSQVLWIRLFPRFIPLAFLGSFHFCGYFVSVDINSFQVVMLQERWQPSAEAVWNISGVTKVCSCSWMWFLSCSWRIYFLRVFVHLMKTKGTFKTLQTCSWKVRHMAIPLGRWAWLFSPDKTGEGLEIVDILSFL